MTRILKSLLLVALGLYLYTRLTTGVIEFYIHPRFISLVLPASVGLLIVAASFFLRQPPDDGHDHDHEGHTHGSLSWLGLFVVAVPVVLGLLVPPQPLGAAAVGNREVQVGSLNSIAPPRGDDRMGLVAGERNILDWLTDFQRNPDDTAFNGMEANLTGFLYRDERFAADEFMLARFVVSCCVADASPIGVIVRTADAAAYADDQWLQVKGAFQVGTFINAQMPILMAEEITPIEQPKQPYLYP